MNPDVEILFQQAMRLDEDKRIEFLRTILESLYRESEHFNDPEYIAEIQRRIDDAERGIGVSYSHEEVMARARQLLEELGRQRDAMVHETEDSTRQRESP